uniref:CSON002139 protein n=1 Tax=Culicoides sonorensis TaxID=179676 RepID=A0A336MIB7_CULSO
MQLSSLLWSILSTQGLGTTSPENRALEMIAAERLKMEKMFLEFNRNNNEPETDRQSPPGQQASQNACWNCGRKAHETCSGCNLARYCGAFCQHKDWEQHHQVCSSLRSAETTQKSSTTPSVQRPPQSQSAALSNGVTSTPK